MQVIATGRGHDGSRVREPGEVFDMPEGVFRARKERGADGKELDGKFTQPSWFKAHTPPKRGEDKKPEGKEGSDEIA